MTESWLYHGFYFSSNYIPRKIEITTNRALIISTRNSSKLYRNNFYYLNKINKIVSQFISISESPYIIITKSKLTTSGKRQTHVIYAPSETQLNKSNFPQTQISNMHKRYAIATLALLFNNSNTYFSKVFI